MKHFFSKFQLIPVALAGLIFVLYYPTLSTYFYNDDFIWLHLIQQSFRSYFENSPMLFRPIIFLYFKINYMIVGMNPTFYHFNNILLHIINTWLVCLLVYQLSRHRWIAAIAALWFAVFFYSSQAVLWISAVSEVLMTTFLLLSFLCWLKFISYHRNRWGMLSMVFYLLGMATHAAALSFVAVIASYSLLYKRKSMLTFRSWAMFGTMLIFSCGYIVMLAMQYQANALNVFTTGGQLSEYVVTLSKSLLAMVAFAPILISSGNDLLARIGWPRFISWLFLGIMTLSALVLIMALIGKKRVWAIIRQPALGVGVLWLLFTLMPFVHLSLGGYIDHRYAYLPSVGQGLVVALMIVSLLKVTPQKGWKIFLVSTAVMLGIGQIIVFKTYQAYFHIEMQKKKAMVEQVEYLSDYRLDGAEIIIFNATRPQELLATFAVIAKLPASQITLKSMAWTPDFIPEAEHYLICEYRKNEQLHIIDQKLFLKKEAFY